MNYAIPNWDLSLVVQSPIISIVVIIVILIIVLSIYLFREINERFVRTTKSVNNKVKPGLDDGLLEESNGRKPNKHKHNEFRYKVIPVKVFSNSILIKIVRVHFDDDDYTFSSTQTLSKMVTFHPRFADILNPNRQDSNKCYVSSSLDILQSKEEEEGDFAVFQDPGTVFSIYAMMRFKPSGYMSTRPETYYFWFFESVINQKEATQNILQSFAIHKDDITTNPNVDQRHLTFDQYFTSVVNDEDLTSPSYHAVINPESKQHGIENISKPIDYLTKKDWQKGNPYLLLDKVNGLVGIQRYYCPNLRHLSTPSGTVPMAFQFSQNSTSKPKSYRFLIIREGEPEVVSSCRARFDFKTGNNSKDQPVDISCTSTTFYLCSLNKKGLRPVLGQEETFLRYNYLRLAFSICGKIVNRNYRDTGLPHPVTHPNILKFPKDFDFPLIAFTPNYSSKHQTPMSKVMCIHVSYSFESRDQEVKEHESSSIASLPRGSAVIWDKNIIKDMVFPIDQEYRYKKFLNYVPTDHTWEMTTPYYGFHAPNKHDRESMIKMRQSLLVIPFPNIIAPSIIIEHSLKFLQQSNYTLYTENGKLLEMITDQNVVIRKEMKVTDRAIYLCCSNTTVARFLNDRHSRSLYCKIESGSSPMAGQVLRAYPLTPVLAYVSSKHEPKTIRLNVETFIWNKPEMKSDKLLFFKVTEKDEFDYILTSKREISITNTGDSSIEILVPTDSEYSLGTIYVITIESLLDFFSHKADDDNFIIPKFLLTNVGKMFTWDNVEEGLKETKL